MKSDKMKKPNFFIVGAPRCGTTSLYRYLQQHPEVYMPECKEPEFFATDLRFRHAIRNEEEYLSLFSVAEDGQRIGEASTFYLFSKFAAKNIKKFSPEAKIIIMLRRPFDQIRSFHNMMLSLYWEGSEDLIDLCDALAAETLRKQGLLLPKGNTMPKECYYYLDIPKYVIQVKRYLEVFGHENVHIIIYDDLKRDVAHTYRCVCDFLDVDRNVKVDLIKYNKGSQIQSYVVWRLLRRQHGILRSVARSAFPARLNHAFLKFFRQLDMNNKQPYRIDTLLEKQLINEFASELQDLSEIIGRDLKQEWSIMK